MAHKYQTLRNRMTSPQKAQAEKRAKEIMAEMFLSEIRKSTGMTQEELAGKLGIAQPSLSQLENQGEMQIGTLKRLIEALGGTLEIVAHLPRGDVRIGQFGG